MAKGKPRDVRKEQLWRQRLREWHASGLTVRAFCLDGLEHDAPSHRPQPLRQVVGPVDRLLGHLPEAPGHVVLVAGIVPLPMPLDGFSRR